MGLLAVIAGLSQVRLSCDHARWFPVQAAPATMKFSRYLVKPCLTQGNIFFCKYFIIIFEMVYNFKGKPVFPAPPEGGYTFLRSHPCRVQAGGHTSAKTNLITLVHCVSVTLPPDRLTRRKTSLQELNIAIQHLVSSSTKNKQNKKTKHSQKRKSPLNITAKLHFFLLMLIFLTLKKILR